MKVIKWLDNHFEEALLIFFLAVISVVELLQVICRNVPFFAALDWAEELCRFAWIATVFLSLGYTIRTNSSLKVTAIADILPWKVHNVLNIFIEAFQCVLLVILSYSSIIVLQRILESGETSPAMQWPMWIMFLIIAIGFILGTLRSLQMFVIHIRDVNIKPMSAMEEQVALETAAEKRNLEAKGGQQVTDEGSDA